MDSSDSIQASNDTFLKSEELTPSTSGNSDIKHESNGEDNSKNGKAQRKRKKKVEIACVYCRRSHMICDDSRPCQRCIKRGIGHLCYDEPSNPRQRKKAANLRQPSVESPGSTVQVAVPQTLQAPLLTPGSYNSPVIVGKDIKPQPLPQPLVSSLNQQQPKNISNSVLAQTLPYNQEPLFYSEHAGSEFSSLNDFLSMIDDPELVNGALNEDPSGNYSMMNFGMNTANVNNENTNNFNDVQGESVPQNQNSLSVTNILSFSPGPNLNSNFQNENEPVPQTLNQAHPQFVKPVGAPLAQPQNKLQNKPQSLQTAHQPVISDSARDKFFLTAADPTTEISPEERLKQVIKAKLEAGLLQPYNYAKGYARLQGFMENYMNVSSRQRILKPLSIFRPAFRAIARTLKDVDLVLVEESFERMLLDYDRVFTSMAIPACLWRRTGEIYRGNKEFASLVGVMTDDLKDGKLAIYELMSEESAVNFWEKYGAIAFDKGQKAVLTSCNLRTKDGIKRKSCCFSFTIRRDRYNIPSCIVGNFIPIEP